MAGGREALLHVWRSGCRRQAAAPVPTGTTHGRHKQRARRTLSRKKGIPCASSFGAISCSPLSMNTNWRAPAPRNSGTRLNATAAGAERLPASSSACSSAQLSRMRWSRDILLVDGVGGFRWWCVRHARHEWGERSGRGAGSAESAPKAAAHTHRAPVDYGPVAGCALLEHLPTLGVDNSTIRGLLFCCWGSLYRLSLALGRRSHPPPWLGSLCSGCCTDYHQTKISIDTTRYTCGVEPSTRGCGPECKGERQLGSAVWMKMAC